MVMTVYASLMLADMKWKIPNSQMRTSPNVKKKIFVGHKSHQTGCNMNCHLVWSKSVCIKVAPLKIQTRDFVIMIYNGIKHLSDFLLLLWYRALIHFHNRTNFLFCHNKEGTITSSKLLPRPSCQAQAIAKEEKYCQRHNGPEGWVHIASSYTNLDQFSFSEYWPSINLVSTKHQHIYHYHT